MAIQHSKLELLVAEIATAIMSPPEARSEPSGADVSSHQGLIDWERYWAHPYRPEYVTLRASLGTSRVDSYWARNADEVRALGRLRNDYFVIFPDHRGRDQVKKYLDTVTRQVPDGPPEIDFEVARRGSGQLVGPLALQRLLADAYDELVRHYPEAWVYSARWFLDGYVTVGGNPPAYFAELNWHLAQYLTARREHPGPLALPRGVPRHKVVAHQTTDRLYGREFGMQSEEMDYNRLLVGSVAQWFGSGASQPQQQPEPLGRWRCLSAWGMIVRDGPGGADTGARVRYGERVLGWERVERVGGYNWLRIHPRESQWIADRWLVQVK